MAEGVWNGVYPQVLGQTGLLLLNKFFDTSIPSMRKVDVREKKKRENNVVYTLTSLPVDRPNADRLCQFLNRERHPTKIPR